MLYNYSNHDIHHDIKCQHDFLTWIYNTSLKNWSHISNKKNTDFVALIGSSLFFPIINTTFVVWKNHSKNPNLFSPFTPFDQDHGHVEETPLAIKSAPPGLWNNQTWPEGRRKSEGVRVQQEKWMANEAEIVSFDFFGWSHVNWKDFGYEIMDFDLKSSEGMLPKQRIHPIIPRINFLPPVKFCKNRSWMSWLKLMPKSHQNDRSLYFHRSIQLFNTWRGSYIWLAMFVSYPKNITLQSSQENR